jgi:branched-chain amino acid transport system ATP-binding protein
MNVIDVVELCVRYGSAVALDGVSLRVSEGEMVALVGSNGAGKTTLLNALSGIVKRDSGEIRIRGRLAHVPEGRQMFPDLTVDDNLRLGAFRSGERDTAWVYRLMPELERTRKQAAGSLSGGQQQMVAIARALMSQPDVLALGEMSLGLAPLIVQRLSRILRDLNRERGLTVLLVEQSVRLAFSLCTRAYVLETGRVVASGATEELARSPFVENAYLGTSEAAP